MATKEEGKRRNWADTGLPPSSNPFLRLGWKWSLGFYSLCVILDEVSTFSILALGGEELNPRLSLILGIHPLLWSLMDIALFLYFVVLSKIPKFKGLAILPLGVGASRLLCFLWNAMQIVLKLTRKE